MSEGNVGCERRVPGVRRAAAGLQTFSTEWLTRLRLAPLYFGRKGLLARLPETSGAGFERHAGVNVPPVVWTFRAVASGVA